MKRSVGLWVICWSGVLAACGGEGGSGEQRMPVGSSPTPTTSVGVPVAPSDPTSPTGVTPSVPVEPGPGPTPTLPGTTPSPVDGPTGAASGPTFPGETGSSAPSTPPGPESTSPVDVPGPTPSVDPPAPSEPVTCGEDMCPMPNGLSHACGQRFALGMNYAWHDFGADFGGLAEWSLGGVTAQRAAVEAEIADMRANGTSVLRWWMFPDFRGDGVEFDAAGDPTGLSATAVSDIQTALDIAEANDVYLVLTPFSFDGFRPTRTDSGVDIPSLTPIVSDAARRATLMENVVRPAAQAVATSPNAQRLLGWDVINEPEWAVLPTGSNDQDFTPNEELDSVSLEIMTAFINDTLAVFEQETPHALRSVGWAAGKWAWAFTSVSNVDFHQPHIYGWVNEYWPYTLSPADLGYGDKPTVMGEFYLLDMPFSGNGDNTRLADILASWYDNGYAGAWAWAYSDADSGPAGLPIIKAFADSKGCSVSF